ARNKLSVDPEVDTPGIGLTVVDTAVAYTHIIHIVGDLVPEVLIIYFGYQLQLDRLFFARDKIISYAAYDLCGFLGTDILIKRAVRLAHFPVEWLLLIDAAGYFVRDLVFAVERP